MDIFIFNILKIQIKEHQKKVYKKEFLEQIVWIVLIEQMLFNLLLEDIFYLHG
jgi:hypothetical protein